MSIIITRKQDAPEDQIIAQMTRNGFEAAAKDYAPGRTEPHRHDYDICLRILAGEFSLAEPEKALVHSCLPGDEVYVGAGTLHYEEHGALRMVVGRRHRSASDPASSSQEPASA